MPAWEPCRTVWHARMRDDCAIEPPNRCHLTHHESSTHNQAASLGQYGFPQIERRLQSSVYAGCYVGRGRESAS